MSYNKDAMAAYKQYGQSMIAGGGGSNLSGLGAKPSSSGKLSSRFDSKGFTPTSSKSTASGKAYIEDYGSDNDDGPTVLYTKAANAATAAGVDLVKAAAKPSVDPKLLYTEPRFNIEQQATKIEDYLRGTAIEDALYEAQGFEKPYTGLYIAEDRPMTEAELQKYKPLIDMADDIMNENITVEELGDMDREDQEAFLRAIGVQGLGPAKRQSSFIGGDFDVATTKEQFIRDLLDAGVSREDQDYWRLTLAFDENPEEAKELFDNKYGTPEEDLIDATASVSSEAADLALIPTTTAKPDVAPTVDTTPPAQTGNGLMSRSRLDGKDGTIVQNQTFDFDYETTSNKLVKDLMKDLDLTLTQASALVGNLAVETADFEKLQETLTKERKGKGHKGGKGFAQWTDTSKKSNRRTRFESWALKNGLDPNSYEANYGYLIKELTTTDPVIGNMGKNTINKLKKADSINRATRIVMDGYLRPGIPHLKKRQDRASDIYTRNRRAYSPRPMLRPTE
jgi:hypothetical protein